MPDISGYKASNKRLFDEIFIDQIAQYEQLYNQKKLAI